MLVTKPLLVPIDFHNINKNLTGVNRKPKKNIVLCSTETQTILSEHTNTYKEIKCL